MEENFHTGDVVCLEWDKTKRFRVTEDEDTLGGEKIRVLYFNELLGVLTTIKIDPKYLKIAPEQD